MTLQKSKNKNKKRIAVLAAVLCIAIPALDHRLKTVRYEMENSRIEQPLTVGLVADLHSCNYGEKQRTITQAIQTSNPDVLLLAGDIIDDDLPEVKAEEFLEWAGKNYDTYYVTGNHEYWTHEIDRLKSMVRNYNIKVLEGDSIPLQIHGNEIDICGIDDPYCKNWSEQLQRASEHRRKGVFSILLTHRPERIEEYLPYRYDLILAGHAHGGQWRIPFLLNGLLAPNQGLFPKYAGGRYDFDYGSMIVSRGLARESTRIVPRIFNRPEYVVIQIRPPRKVKANGT